MRKAKRKSEMSKRNGNGSGGGLTISAATTLPLGLLVFVLGGTISIAWWASTVSNDMRVLSRTVEKLETKATSIDNDVNTMKFDIKDIRSSVNQINSETTKRPR